MDELFDSPKGGQFDYANVWKNQSEDVHPPLYYVMLHTICSLFPEKFSVWYAAIINIGFALLILYISKKLFYELTRSESGSFLFSIYFILSSGILAAVAFMRMYIITMFWVTLITYLFVIAVKDGFSFRMYGKIILVSIMGALTHYYFVVYLFFLCLVMEGYLLYRRKIMDGLILFFSMCFGGGITVLIFPAALSHLFESGRGKESFQNLEMTSVSEYFEKLKIFYGFINEQLFGGILSYIILTVFVLISLWIWEKARKQEVTIDLSNLFETKDSMIQWLLLIIPSIFYLFLISKIAVYQEKRYIQPIYAVTMVGISVLVWTVWKRVVSEKNQKLLACCLLAVMTVGSFNSLAWDVLYQNSVSFLKATEKYSESKCVFIYDESYRMTPAYYEVQNYKSLVGFSEENVNEFRKLGYGDEDNLIVCIVNTCNVDNVLKLIMNECPEINKYEKVGSFGYASTYYLFGEGITKEKYLISDYEHKGMIGIDLKPIEAGREVGITSNENKIKIVFQNGEENVTLCLENKALDIKEGKFTDGNSIQLFYPNGSDAQKWKISPNSDGSVTIFSKDPKFVMTRMTDGKVCLGEYREGDTAQKWWLEKCEE